MVDRDDDIKLGLKSSAILFGRFDVAGVMICHALFLLCMTYVGVTARCGVGYFSGLVVAACVIAYQYLLIRERRREGCFSAFMLNNFVGAAVWAGIIAEFWWRIPLFPAATIAR
jgi:4-hydroxybenzoate polyprenyltransferase